MRKRRGEEGNIQWGKVRLLEKQQQQNQITTVGLTNRNVIGIFLQNCLTILVAIWNGKIQIDFWTENQLPSNPIVIYAIPSYI